MEASRYTGSNVLPYHRPAIGTLAWKSYCLCPGHNRGSPVSSLFYECFVSLATYSDPFVIGLVSGEDYARLIRCSVTISQANYFSLGTSVAVR